MAKQYKVEVVTEGGCGTILLGSAAIPTEKVEAVMNKYGAEGWDMDFMVVERRRMMWFWTREAVIITFSKNK